MIAVRDADDAASLDQVRALLGAFAAEFGALTAEVFAVQGFAAEAAGLPGRYAPPAGCLLLAADEAGAPLGCVALRDLGGGTCEMKRLFVDPAGRGRGVGRLLVDAVIRRAEGLGYRRMVLDTLPAMAGAVALYREFGFADTPPYWGHPAPGAIFLARPLEPGPPDPPTTGAP